MNTTQLKAYAPKARLDFIEAVKARAAKFGITESDPVEMMVRGDVAMIYGEAYPKEVYHQRQGVLDLIKTKGFEPAMEAMAYTWFNRLVALRYMELHGFLDHGYRVLSHPEGATSPEILQHARHIELPDLDQDQVTELMLAGNRDEELYGMLLLAQCHALHVSMPFLFEPIDDATELLLPDNLLHSDSLIRKLVEVIPEQDWETVEVIGWLYQFYISEKKDQVIGKVVKSEDIPAATQLFTPNWIVKYMVQNSLGAQWLATYPLSPLKGQMEYYIEPAEQTDEVNAQLAAITPSQLNPEELTLIDPASGSGHILVEAYELFKVIYLERGYRQRDVPQLILEKNLFGLDIDERAAQLTGFALMMKGRADDRRLFERGVKLNVMALQDSAGFDAEVLANGVELGDYRLKPGHLTELKRLFEHATTFGSLIQVSERLAERLSGLKRLSETTSSDMFVARALDLLGPLVQQAEMLVARYDTVMANPPYMGRKGMNALLKKFAKDHFRDAKSDLFACFIERGYTLAKDVGHVAMVTMQSWMFLSSFQEMRERMLRTKTITTMTQIGYNSFPSMNSKVAQATVFSLANHRAGDFIGSFIDLNSAPQSADKDEVFLAQDPANRFDVSTDEFKKIPGSPVAYWISGQTRRVFSTGVPLGEVVDVAVGLQTGDNERFLRRWPEVPFSKAGFGFDCSSDAEASEKKWFPYNKGGEFRKWYGNQELLVNWEGDGSEIIEFQLYLNSVKAASSKMGIANNSDYYFKTSVTWTKTSTSYFGVRHSDPGAVFDVAGSSAFPSQEDHFWVVGLLCSKQVCEFMKMLNPTLSFQTGNVRALPVLGEQVRGRISEIESVVRPLVSAARSDWDAYERSWDFQSLPLLTAAPEATPTLESGYTAWTRKNRNTIAEMKRLEEENNRLFIDAYGLADELTPDVPIEQVTLTVNPAYRYGGKLTEEEQWTRFRQDTMEELVSYAIGCMMGRYSLDEPGLIYAHSGNEGFDPSQYTTFPGDDDGIVPITDTGWFDDDACNRLVEFIAVAWDEKHLEENLTFLAENLGPKTNEASRDTIRRYLNDKFFKSHLKAYKKRPIYWLFSSGKQKALQCLVYLHRYNESTLSRMRMDYAIPRMSRLGARIENLQQDIEAATSTAQANKLRRELDLRKKQNEELREYDEKLRHYADQRITLDLDDGVKVNYGKFGDLLAEVPKIHGRKPQ